MKRLLSLSIALTLVLSLLVFPVSAQDDKQATILFTHDTHSCFLPKPAADGGQTGGYARLSTVLTAQRAAAPGAVLTVDAGDFSMGSLFQTAYSTDAGELRMLGALGYDAVTLGNHEYDYRAQIGRAHV